MGDREETKKEIGACEVRSAERGLKIVRTHLGWVGVAETEAGIVAIVLPRKSKAAVVRELEQVRSRTAAVGPAAEPVLARAVKQLERYFAGKSLTFDLHPDLSSYTPFQRAVWNAAAEIPFGETRSYGWIAKRIKKPNAARAVGQAMGANPVPLLVP